jgi:predicted transcriptional regulator
MNATITVSIPRKMNAQIERIAKRENIKKTDIVRGALNRYVGRMELDAIREVMVPEAQKKGIFTDEDVFKLVS